MDFNNLIIYGLACLRLETAEPVAKACIQIVNFLIELIHLKLNFFLWDWRSIILTIVIKSARTDFKKKMKIFIADMISQVSIAKHVHTRYWCV